MLNLHLCQKFALKKNFLISKNKYFEEGKAYAVEPVIVQSKIENKKILQISLEAEFNNFEPRLKFETQLKYSWFHLKMYLMFHELSRRSIETRLKFIKFADSERRNLRWTKNRFKNTYFLSRTQRCFFCSLLWIPIMVKIESKKSNEKESSLFFYLHCTLDKRKKEILEIIIFSFFSKTLQYLNNLILLQVQLIYSFLFSYKESEFLPPQTQFF